MHMRCDVTLVMLTNEQSFTSELQMRTGRTNATFQGLCMLFVTMLAGKRTLVVRGAGEGNSCALEIWVGNRVNKEMMVPKKVHGGVYNDGWFGSGAAWSSDESRIAYVAEVGTLCFNPPLTSTLASHLCAA